MGLWSRLPDGFLKMKFGTWSRLDHDVRTLIVKLADGQSFKCALCDTAKGLVVDHDHDPEHGRSDKFTIYNIRGLVCGSCNWYIGMYEAEQRGDYTSWPDVFHTKDYESYFWDYQCRVGPLLQTMLRERLGIQNYWKRRNLLSKFDEWREWGGKYPWYWGFDEIKDKKYGPIRGPKHALRTMVALLKYVSNEFQKNPDYDPPEEVIRFLLCAKSIADLIGPIAEERRRQLTGET